MLLTPPAPDPRSEGTTWMPSEGYRVRRSGSVRFDPYYKLDVFDRRRMAWHPLRRKYPTEREARSAALLWRRRWRLLRVTEDGYAIIHEQQVPGSGPTDA